MATIRPFHGIHYAVRKDLEISKLIAPPFDVLNDASKAALQAKHPNNIVTIDLPFLPPKSVGPDEVYQKANTTLDAWLKAGILVRDRRAALYPYSQSFELKGRTFHRRGFFCVVKIEPFGEKHIFPHEKTYRGAIEDRLRLMRATGAQLSPVFGLYNDPRDEVHKILFQGAGKPMLDGTLDGIRSQLWSVIDAEIENKAIELMGTKSIYIADGHHRYTTALTYLEEAEKAAGGKLPPAHPANYCMFVLINMHDDGLLILPTHRMIGGLSKFDIKEFKSALGSNFELAESKLEPPKLAEAIEKDDPHTFGLFDGVSRKSYTLKLKNLDILKALEPKQSDALRKLDVSILQRYLLDEVIQPKFAGGKELTKSYTADAHDIAPQVDGTRHQIGIILRSTPLQSLEDLAKHGEVMPQKSTYFFPKLATGMMINSVKP